MIDGWWITGEPRKNPPTFYYTGWLIGILIVVYYIPYLTGQYNPLYNPTNQGFFHCSGVAGEAVLNEFLENDLMFNLKGQGRVYP